MTVPLAQRVETLLARVEREVSLAHEAGEVELRRLLRAQGVNETIVDDVVGELRACCLRGLEVVHEGLQPRLAAALDRAADRR